jgi:hypothetical protein
MRFTGSHGVRINRSAGVVVLETNRIFGGDSWTFYTGRYERRSDGSYDVSVQTGVYNTEGGQDIMGGPPKARRFIGQVRVADDQKSIAGKLTVEGSPEMLVTVELTRVAELP